MPRCMKESATRVPTATDTIAWRIRSLLHILPVFSFYLTLCPTAGKCHASQHKHGIHTSVERQCGRPSVARGARFFAYSTLIIGFKGVLMNLKIVVLAISEEKLIFTIFLHFTVKL